MKKLLWGALTAWLMGAAAVSQAGPPQPSLSDVVYDTVIENGVKTELKLDVYLPPSHYPGTRPVVMFIHGGCFNAGGKGEEGIRAPASEFAADGFVVLSVDYRLASQAPYPAAMNDVRQALRWARQNAAAYRIDPSRIIAYGQSAGSTLAAMLGVQPAYARGMEGVEDEYARRVNMVVDFYGRTDFTHDQFAGDTSRIDCAETYLGMKRESDPDRFKKASVLPYVDKQSAPFLIFHGLNDTNVLPLHSQRLHQALLKAGVPSTLVLQEEGIHNMPNVYAPSMARRADDPNVQQRFAHILIKKAFHFGHTWRENSWSLRIDAGNVQPNAPAGFIADSFAVGGQPYSYGQNGVKIADPLYDTVRFSESSFAYHLANNQPGFKRIKLDFIEPYRNGPGWRMTDVAINGFRFLVDFDAFAMAPDDMKPVVQEVYFYATSPTTQLQFIRKATGNAAVAGVEMFSVDEYCP